MATGKKVEFAVEMKDDCCVRKVKSLLKNYIGVSLESIDVNDQSVIVTSSLPSSVIKDAIESTGCRAVIKGLNAADDTGYAQLSHGSSAVAELTGGDGAIRGVVRFIQISPSICEVDGTIDGLSPSLCHRLAIHEFGDVSQGADSCGDVLGVDEVEGLQILAGDIGCIEPTEKWRATFVKEAKQFTISDIIGRSLVVHSNTSQTDTFYSTSRRCGCAVIARSASVKQNPKMFCTCDGVAIWDERDVPAAGPARQKHANTS